MTNYIKNSNRCMHAIIPNIVKAKIKEYKKKTNKKKMENQVRSMHVLYEGGLICKRKYTSIRNSSDVAKETGRRRENVKTKSIAWCEIPKVLPYKALMNFVRGINKAGVLSLESLAAKFSLEHFLVNAGP